MITSRTSSHTHISPDKLSKEDISNELNRIKTRLTDQFKNEPDKLAFLLKSADELSEFELGRFCIKNKGALSGYWTWYLILGFNRNSQTTPLEQFLVEKSPMSLSTRDRFKIFQTLLTQHIKSNSVVCSIPCGMMADLLTLNLPEKIIDVRFVGIDLDASVIELAKDLAKKSNVTSRYEFFQQDAWNLNFENEFDMITTNGLNIYEKDDNHVVALYRGLHKALKNKGRLICSAITPPEEWEMSKVNQNDLLEAGALFRTVLEATWANFRTSEQTCQQLKEAGFENIEVHWDSRKMFPTFCGQKSG